MNTIFRYTAVVYQTIAVSFKGLVMSFDLVNFTTDLLSAWNDHDIPRILSFYTQDCYGEDVSQAIPILDHHGVEQAATSILLAFPDLHFKTEQLLIQDNRLAIFWTMHGTQQGVVMNIPPSGRAVKVRGSSLFILDRGKIARSLHIWDVAGLLRAIGLLPEL